MNEARHRMYMYTRKSGKPLKIMALPPTEHNLSLHILRAYRHARSAKSADQQAPPKLDIAKYGWKIKNGSLVPETLDQS